MALVQLKTPVRFTSITCCHSLEVILLKVASRVIPALLIRISIRPYVEATILAILSVSSLSVVSNTKASHLYPFDLSSAKVSSHFSLLISQIITVAPSLANFKETAFPIPDAPPVMTAILFCNLFMCFYLLFFNGSRSLGTIRQ